MVVVLMDAVDPFGKELVFKNAYIAELSNLTSITPFSASGYVQ